MDKSLDDNCRSNELVLHNAMDYEVHNEKFVIQKSKVGISVVLVISKECINTINRRGTWRMMWNQYN